LGYDTGKDENGKVHYHLNVRKHPLICTTCPIYKEKTKWN